MKKFDSIQADIPLPKAVQTLSDLFAQNRAALMVAGGVVRDFLFHLWHGQPFDPKDVDLATEALPWQVVGILNSKEAKELGVTCFPKGEAFGVISAMVGGEEYEIATFREEWYDPESGDGRRPDQVSYSTPEADAKRRDLTMNALLYHLESKEIRDYNLDGQGLGQGFRDIRAKVARPVGSARERFREDKLRIPRLVRFYCRFNDGDFFESFGYDMDIIRAIREFADLKGVSPERIANEFAVGLQKCKNPAHYVLTYIRAGLMPAVFPDLVVDRTDTDRIGDCRNLKAVLAWLFKFYQQSVRSQLNDAKYPNDVSDAVHFLVKWHHFAFMGGAIDPRCYKDAGQLLKQRDLYKQLEGEKREETLATFQKDLRDFAKVAELEDEAEFFLSYQSPVKTQDYLHLKGRAIGEAIAAAEAEAYRKARLEWRK